MNINLIGKRATATFLNNHASAGTVVVDYSYRIWRRGVDAWSNIDEVGYMHTARMLPIDDYGYIVIDSVEHPFNTGEMHDECN